MKNQIVKTKNTFKQEVQKLWYIVQMIAKTAGAGAILFGAVKHVTNQNIQYVFAVIAAVLLFSVLWNIYTLLSKD